MSERYYYVYILASLSNSTVYVGVTSDLLRRVYEHKKGFVSGFSKKYNCKKLVYYEIFSDVEVALNREKQIKKWRREKKDALMDRINPNWEDLYEKLK